ncbi:MAG: type II toxin-antitoxin system HicB family antitoxin, partial [Prochloraceae cyanobacterium]
AVTDFGTHQQDIVYRSSLPKTIPQKLIKLNNSLNSMTQKINRPVDYNWDGFTIKIYLDDQKDWLAHLEELPNVSAFGDTPEAALDELYVAWEGMKECYRIDGEPIPVAPQKV